jgi:hypothetical protein
MLSASPKEPDTIPLGVWFFCFFWIRRVFIFFMSQDFLAYRFDLIADKGYS